MVKTIQAASVVGEIGCTPGYPCASTNSFGELLQTGISVVMVLALVVMIGFLVKGAYTYITSGANAKARADGLNTIKWAVIGILVLAAALVFYQLIQLVIGRSLIDIY